MTWGGQVSNQLQGSLWSPWIPCNISYSRNPLSSFDGVTKLEFPFVHQEAWLSSWRDFAQQVIHGKLAVMLMPPCLVQCTLLSGWQYLGIRNSAARCPFPCFEQSLGVNPCSPQPSFATRIRIGGRLKKCALAFSRDLLYSHLLASMGRECLNGRICLLVCWTGSSWFLPNGCNKRAVIPGVIWDLCLALPVSFPRQASQHPSKGCRLLPLSQGISSWRWVTLSQSWS